MSEDVCTLVGKWISESSHGNILYADALCDSGAKCFQEPELRLNKTTDNCEQIYWRRDLDNIRHS